MVKQFNERFSGWGTETSSGGVAGLEGYSRERAEQVARDVRSNMALTSGIIDIKVDIVPIGNGNFCVTNNSTYESLF